MQVTRVEIFGFKSFMERLVLPLEGGITGVVGPNGCGKSNIVDALRWVLGETRASNLRGEVLEDVIFNGTDALRPLGLAEVTITLRAHKENFFEDLLTPQAESELAALLEQPIAEVSETEAPTESPPAEPSAEEGRKVAHLTVIYGNLSGKKGEAAEDNSAEQPSDTSAETHSVEPTPSPEKTTRVGEQPSQALLARFSWLQAANEVQITRRLYRSGESEFFINRVPCRLKDIKDLLRAVGLGPRSYTIVAQGEVSRIITARPEDRRLIIEEAAGIVGLRDRIAASRRRLEETTQNLARINDVIGEVSRQVGSLKRQAARAEARAELKQRIATLDTALYTDKLLDFAARADTKNSAVMELKEREERAQSSLQSAQAEEESARSTLLGLDVNGDALRANIDSIRGELESRNHARFEKSSRVNELRATTAAKEDEAKRLEERSMLLTQRSGESKSELTALRERLEAVSNELSGIERDDDAELRASAAELAGAREGLKLKDQELRTVRERAIALHSSLDEIDQQIIALSPLTQLQKTLGQNDSEVLNKIRESATMLLADALKVPEPYARAVQAVLAERAAFLLSENPHRTALEFVNGPLRDPRIRKAGLGLGLFRSGESTASAQPEGVPFPSVLSLIEVAPEAKLAAERMFSGVFIVETAEAGIRFFEGHSDAAGITIVTTSGEILTDASFFALPHEGGIIQFRNRANDLRTELQGIETRQAELHTEKDTAQRLVNSAEERHRKALQASQDDQARVRQLSNEQGSARGRLEAAERLVVQLAQDAQKISEQIAAAKQSIDASAQRRLELEAELAAMTSDDERELKSNLENLNAQYAELEPIRKASRQKLAATSQLAEEGRRELDSTRNLMSQALLDVQRLELEASNIKERITTEYGAEAADAITAAVQNGCARLNPVQHSEFSDEVERLKTRIVREGDVDPTTIEQYAAEKLRLDDLTSQKNDLEAAIRTLERTIEQLTSVSQERFLATFNAVRENFSRLIPRLFGGGKGSLELIDPHHPLESGVEIVARPPGKKLKSIEIMSGGEKALCATGLIFSMFLVRPSPLCVLDEIDAPLDDANLVRLLSLIKEISSRTQFIMITHNKQSMSAASNLVGVTMQEPGATRIITVSLQEAYKQVG